jgi:hypothetical protein
VAAFFIETPLAANHPRGASHHRGHRHGIAAIEQLLIVGGMARLDAILGQHLIQMLTRLIIYRLQRRRRLGQRRQQGKAGELRATTSLARLWQRQGRRYEARTALAAIYNTYTEGLTTPDLVDAKALLESLAGAGTQGNYEG